MDAQNIAKELVGTGLTQTEIAKRAGVSQSIVALLLAGKRGKRTSFDVVQKLTGLLAEVRSAKAEAAHA